MECINLKIYIFVMKLISVNKYEWRLTCMQSKVGFGSCFLAELCNKVCEAIYIFNKHKTIAFSPNFSFFYQSASCAVFVIYIKCIFWIGFLVFFEEGFWEQKQPGFEILVS